MPVSHEHVGHRFMPLTARVEAGRLRFFHKAIGVEVGNNEGVVNGNGQTVPPTYLFCLEMMDAENPFGFIEEIGGTITEILHADQSFTYHAQVKVGDTLTFQARVVDIFDKKGGLLTFVVQEVEVTNQDGDCVADIKRTFVIQNRAEVA